jgi:hypothetical protein
MGAMEEAIAALESLSEGEHFTYQEIADRYGVNRSTLSRRYRGVQRSMNEYAVSKQLLSPNQEEELVNYIIGLTERGLPPTKEMIQSFARTVVKKEVGEGWILRFVERNKDALISKWTTGMDRNRHQADSEHNYSLYFDLLEFKMNEYSILPENTYNMDEKGFMIGRIGRSKRIFSKALWDRKQVTSSLQDGNREWISVLACICADGSALPPGLIFEGLHGNIRDTWVDGISQETPIFATSSPTGWSNDDIGLAWLVQVFDRYTKEKAGRSWRLLLLDGHGSHITMPFLAFCTRNRILLMIYPPHATHSLQALDVVMFKSLSSEYSKGLINYTHQSMGTLPVKKGDFVPLFWSAWISSFTEKLIFKAFEATGIWPRNRDTVLKRFKHKPITHPDKFTSLMESDWRRVRQVMKAVTKEGAEKEVNQVTQALHHYQVQNDLLLSENQGLRESLGTKKKHNKHGKRLNLRKDSEWFGGADWWSPKKFDEALEREEEKTANQEQIRLERAEMKELRASNQLFNKKLQEERRIARETAKKERVREKEMKAQEQARKKQQKQKENQAANLPKPVQQPQRGNRTISKKAAPKRKRVEGCTTAASGDQGGEPSQAPPPKVTRTGRNITIPSKFR